MIFKKLILLSLLFISLFCSVYSYQGEHEVEINNGLEYLYSCQRFDGGFGEHGEESNVGLTSNAIISIASVGENPSNWKKNRLSPVDYLLNYDREKINPSSLPMYTLALIASNLSTEDSIDNLISNYNNFEYGEGSYLFDDMWSLIILSSYEGYEEYTSISKEHIIKNQNLDGGWGYMPNIESDFDSTSLALISLISSGESTNSEIIQNSLDFLKNESQPIPFILSSAENTATLSLLIQANLLVKNDLDNFWENKSLFNELLKYQMPDGSFTWTKETYLNPCSMTSSALKALSMNPFPKSSNSIFNDKIRTGGEEFDIDKRPSKVDVKVRIEGENITFWSGTITVTNESYNDSYGMDEVKFPNVVGAIVEALDSQNIYYEINDTFGVSFSKVGDDSGLWHYRINNQYSEICPIIQKLNDGDEVILYRGYFYFKPLKVETEILNETSRDVLIKVKAFNTQNQSWISVKNATIFIGNNKYYSNEYGEVNILNLNQNSSFTVFAEKLGYIRSEKLNFEFKDVNKESYLKYFYLVGIIFIFSLVIFFVNKIRK